MVLIKTVKIVPNLDGWLLVGFDNGERKLIDINPHMEGVLGNLKDQKFFEQVFIDKELQTITWPGELDLDPDTLYNEGIAIKVVEDLVTAVKTNANFAHFIDEQIG